MTPTRRKLRCERLETRLTPGFTPVGPEFRVNTVTEGYQSFPSVATDAAGNFVVAFSGYDGGSSPGWGVFARLFNADGTPRGDQFRVGYSAAPLPTDVAVAMDATGDFAVTWTYFSDLGSPVPWNNYAQRYDATGIPQGSVFAVNEATTVSCLQPAIAMNADGEFAIAWGDGNGRIFARHFGDDGAPGNQILASSGSGGSDPAIAIAADGSFVVVWQANQIRGRRYYSNGQPVGTDFSVRTTPGWGARPTMAMDAAGSFAVSWEQGSSPYFRRFSADAAPLGSDIEGGAGPISGRACVAMDADADLVLTWGVTTYVNIIARGYSSDGTPMAPFQVNSYANDVQRNATVDMDADGDGIVTWESFGQDGSSWGVYAQRFAGPNPTVGRSYVNNGAVQRSTVSAVKLDLTRQSLFPPNPADAFELVGPGGVVPVSVSFAGSSPAGTVATLTFSGGPLADGLYSMRVKAALVHDTAGQAFDGNGDGVPGDDFVMSFHKLLGDFDGDADVDGVDFLMFRPALNSTQPTFDLDADGDVDAEDFLAFRSMYGNRL